MLKLQAHKLSKANKTLFFLVVVSLILRIIGDLHSFPLILHPDEPTIVRSALEVRFYNNPKHFDWPHLYIYLNYFLYMVFAKVRTLLEALNLKASLINMFPLIWDDTLIFYYLTRLFSSLFGAMTLIPIYYSAQRLFNEKVALLSAMTFTLLPYHIWHSQYSLPDVPMVFFLSCALYFSVLIFKNNSIKAYLLAGLFTGFAASTKYNGGLIAIGVAFAHFCYVYKAKEKLFAYGTTLKPLLATVFALLGFLIGTPFAFFDYVTFSRTDGPQGAFWQFTNVGEVPLAAHMSKFFTLFFTKLADDFGYTALYTYLIVLILATLFLSFYFLKRKFFDRVVNVHEIYALLLLLVPSLFFFYYIAGFEKSRSHYYFITYPYVSIISGFFLYKVADYLKKINNQRLWYVFFVAYFLLPILAIVQNTLERWGVN